MKICQFVGGHLPPGGFEYVVHHLSNALVGLGHEVTVFARAAPDKMSILDNEKTNYRIFRYWLPRSKGLFHRSIIKIMLRRKMKENKFDIVHAHQLYPAGYWALSSLGAFRNIIVATAHGEDVLIAAEYSYGKRLNKRIDRKIRWTLKEGRYFTAVSSSLKNEMVALGGAEGCIRVIPNGVNLESFRGQNVFESVKPYLFSMGRLVFIKGYDIVIKTFAKITEENYNIDLIIAGRGPEEGSLRDLVRKKGLSGRVKFVGFVDGEKKVSLLKGSRFCVCPSRREGLGLANIEALAAGKPVVAFDVDGISDIIEPGKNGLLAKPGDSEDLASKMQILLRDENLRERMGRQALRMARKYDWRQIAKKYESLYCDMVSS